MIYLNSTLLFFLMLLISCSQINRKEQDYFQDKVMRHGIIPVEKKISTDKLSNLDTESVKRGEKIYSAHCFDCHGKYGRGDGPKAKENSKIPKDLVKMAKAVPNFKIFMMVSKWQGDMPGWKAALSDKELEDVKNYIYHLSKTN